MKTESVRKSRKPITCDLRPVMSMPKQPHGCAVPKPYVVFVHGVTRWGDSIARSQRSYATYGEAYVDAAADDVVEDATIGPTADEL